MKGYRALIGAFVVLVGLFAGITLAQADPVAGDTVTVAGQAKAITGVNVYRATNSFIVYTPANGATTGTNAFGFEAAVVNGSVTQVQNGVGSMTIPAGGYVLSGHGTSRTWLQTYATVGAAVTIPNGTPTPPPGANSVTVAGQNKALDGTNVYRASNFLVRYTPANGATTGANAFGFEAAVVNNVVTQVANGVGNMAIPANGYVLSGHGTARTWLIANARVGVPVTLGSGTTDPPGKPANVTETRSNAVSANCQILRVTVSNQTRTNTWQWNGTAWVDNWSAWTNTGTQTTRPATSADCVNVVPSLSSDVLLPDIRIKNLDKCGAGDMQATGGKCFLIRNPNPNNADFPALNGIKFLKFPVITLNVGAGPAEVIAERAPGSGAWTAWQTFYRPNGVRESQVAPNTEFYFAGDGHNHWHFKDFDSYWIESLSGTVLRTAEKHGYCLEDNTTWSGLNGQPGVPTSPVYANATTCGQGLPNALNLIEGLSRGWGDTYSTSLPDQGINISGLADGRYRVGITADAIGAVRESNENNNTATMEISISGNTVTTYPTTATGGLS